MPSADDDIAGLAAALRPALLHVSRRIRQQRGENALPLPQLSALYTLAIRGPLTAGDLAHIERVQPPSLTKVLTELEQRGLIVRTVGPSDGRHVFAQITTAGDDLLRQDRELVDAWLFSKLSALAEDELHLLSRVLHLFDVLASER